jgi:MFS family permease
MMFLEFAIQGAWLPLIFGFLVNHRGIAQETVGNILAVGAIGAMLSPLIAGQIADRYMNAERVMAILHFIGAAVVLRLAYSSSPGELYFLSFTYGILYTPTLALVNAISFRHLPNPSRDFGKVRVWGTAGWIVSGILIGQWLYSRAHDDVALQFAFMTDAMKLSAILGVILGLYSFTLPATPPTIVKQREAPPSNRDDGSRVLSYETPQKRRSKLAPVEALREILRQPLLTLFALSFIIAAVHSFFFARAAEYLTKGPVRLPAASWINKIFGVGGAGLMTVGQISELLVLALMPILIPRINRKILFAVGLCAYALRFFIFAYFTHPAAIIFGLALHGLVFGCFFFLVFITLDEYTTKDVRSSAQNVFNLIIFGVGVILGNWLSGQLGKWVTSASGATNWQQFYAIPGWITLACLAAFLIFYPNRAPPRHETATAA